MKTERAIDNLRGGEILLSAMGVKDNRIGHQDEKHICSLWKKLRNGKAEREW